MKKLLGIQVSQGVAVAPIKMLYDLRTKVVQSSIDIKNVDLEYKRFKKAVNDSKEELNLLISNNTSQTNKKTNDSNTISNDIIDVYLMLLDDPDFHNNVYTVIKHTFSNAEWAVKKVIHSYSNKLEISEDRYLAERIHDLNEIGILIINYLSGRQGVKVSLTSPSILVAHNLLPTQFMKIPRQHIKGIVLEEGGMTSHTAIIAKAYGIPMITGVSEVFNQVKDAQMAVLDAISAELIVDVEESVLKHYKKIQDNFLIAEKKLLQTVKSIKHKSPEGDPLIFELNLDAIEELDSSVVDYADGIGLFRSEFILGTIEKHHDSEDKQFRIYKNLLERNPHKEITIRTFDSGGDKVSISVKQINEENPLLGYRGIRFCLGDKEFFLCQIKALLRASCYGTLRILIPMISSVYEIQQVQAIITRAKKALIKENKKFKDDVPIGILIEVPSVIFIIKELSEYCDFFSVGTNDLLQYTMAADRGNYYVRNLYSYYQPSFLRVLREIFYQVNDLNVNIGLCGEMASFRPTVPLLLGAGLRRFSVSPSQLLNTIYTATSYKISDTRILFENVMKCKTDSEVKRTVEDFNRDYDFNSR